MSVIGIIGAGLIGSSLAALFTGHGFPVVVFLRDATSLEKGRQRYDSILNDLAEGGQLTRQQVEICASYVSFSSNPHDLLSVSFLFEAIPEDLIAKKTLYQWLEELDMPNLRGLASTTSVFAVKELSSDLKNLKNCFFVVHPMNPPHLVLLFEISPCPAVPPVLVDGVMELMRHVGRVPVLLKKSVPGLIANRLQYALFREAISLVEAGVVMPEDIDLVLMHSFVPRYTSIGLFDHIDNAGLDLLANASNYLFPYLSTDQNAQDLILNHVREGELGCKAGKGVYVWHESEIKEMRRKAELPYLASFNWILPGHPLGKNE